MESQNMGNIAPDQAIMLNNTDWHIVNGTL